MEIAWKIQQGLDFLVSILLKIMFPDCIPKVIGVVLKIMKGTEEFFHAHCRKSRMILLTSMVWKWETGVSTWPLAKA